jgi:hypothetical protein
LELRLPSSCELAEGDPVFAFDSSRLLQQVGIIVSRSNPTSQREANVARAVLFDPAPDLSQVPNAYYLSTPDSIEWVVQTLLPPDRRKQIEAELTAAIKEHHREILHSLEPVVNKSVREALGVLEQDLPLVLEKHRPELRAIAGRGKEEILQNELLPLVKAEVWPIIRQDSEPLVRQVSCELWDRVSLWGFAWRGLVDKLPWLGGKNRVEQELARFLDQEAMPIFERHERDFLGLIETIVQDVSRNDKVRSGLKRSLARVAEDPELQRVLKEVFHEAVVENPRFWNTVRQNLSSPEARNALQVTATRLEPTVRRVGDLVLGTREEGLTPEFTRVLREQVLLKDRHTVVVGDLPSACADWPCTHLEAWFSGN